MMNVAFLVALCLLGPAAGSANAEDKNRPVNKVIAMLKDMSAQLNHESEVDEEAYDRMTCYCETNDKENTKSIADAEQKVTDLMSTVEMLTAKSASLNSEVEALNAEIGGNNNALARAAGIREKEKAEFVGDEKNMLTSITGLKSAVTVMGKHHDSAAFDQEALLGLSESVKHLLGQRQLKVSHKQSRVLKGFAAFLQKAKKNPGAFLQQAPSAGSYAPQSGQIFGVLQQMKESFETNLASAQSEETKSASDFQSMKVAKVEEIKAAQNKVLNKEEESADAAEKTASAKEDLASTRGQLAADTEFLSDLKRMCGDLDRQYGERTQTRTQEIAAVGETIGILTDDDARDQFSKTLGLLQLSSRTRRVSAKELASRKLMALSRLEKNPRLADIAFSMRLDAFGLVKEKVEAMITDLKAEGDEEIKMRDECTENLHKNEKHTTAKYAEKDDLQATIDDLSNTIANLKDEVSDLKSEVSMTMIGMKRASEDREIENKDFQTTVADQRATQMILTRALERLKEFYASKAAALVQSKSSSRKQDPDPGAFTTYKKSEKSGGVVAMIQGVIDDSKALETEAIAGEQNAQSAYETFVSDSNKSIAAASKAIAEKTAVMGTQDEALVTAKGDMKGVMADLESLNNINKQTHWDCDFVTKNFEARQEARANEVEALQQSVAMLSGAK